MNTQRLSAILLIAIFMSIMLSSLVNAPGLYATQDITERLEIIEKYQTRWLSERAFVVLFALLTVVAFPLLASVLRSVGGGWIPVLASGAVVAGAISGLYFIYLQTIDPRGGYSGAYLPPENLAYWLLLAGLFLFGIAFFKVDFPAWLGYLTVGAALLYGIVFLITGVGFASPFLVGILSLVIGIVLLRK